MSELCLSSISKAHFSALIISNFFLFCSFILSHPLYFSCFIFFSPYLLKLLSYLSPLFITTSLLLLAFLTVSPSFINDNFSKESSCSIAESKVSVLTALYRAVVERLRSKIDNQNEEFLRLEDFEVFKLVFDNPTTDDAKGCQIEVLDTEVKDDSFQAFGCPVLARFGQQDFNLSTKEALASNLESDNFSESESNWSVMEEEKRLEGFFQELDEFENVKVTRSVENNKVGPPCTEANKAVEKQGENTVVRNGSEAAGNKIRDTSVEEVGKDNGREYKSKLLKEHSHSIGASADHSNDNGDYSLKIQSSPSLDYNLGSSGSMRKEKDWKRTLACKLFEERNNANGGEGMDLLWETHEMESIKNKANSKSKKKKNNNKKKCEIKYREEEEEEIDDNGHDDEEDGSDAQLCCLQALKFSAGKMNLGMGRPNLVKISKAIKGIGWLHNLSRHSKKVHNGDRF